MNKEKIIQAIKEYKKKKQEEIGNGEDCDCETCERTDKIIKLIESIPEEQSYTCKPETFRIKLKYKSTLGRKGTITMFLDKEKFEKIMQILYE